MRGKLQTELIGPLTWKECRRKGQGKRFRNLVRESRGSSVTEAKEGGRFQKREVNSCIVS
jgi:hypothetical protein